MLFGVSKLRKLARFRGGSLLFPPYFIFVGAKFEPSAIHLKFPLTLVPAESLVPEGLGTWMMTAGLILWLPG